MYSEWQLVQDPIYFVFLFSTCSKCILYFWDNLISLEKTFSCKCVCKHSGPWFLQFSWNEITWGQITLKQYVSKSTPAVWSIHQQRKTKLFFLWCKLNVLSTHKNSKAKNSRSTYEIMPLWNKHITETDPIA